MVLWNLVLRVLFNPVLIQIYTYTSHHMTDTFLKHMYKLAFVIGMI